jgi:hypothetical protein
MIGDQYVNVQTTLSVEDNAEYPAHNYTFTSYKETVRGYVQSNCSKCPLQIEMYCRVIS